MSPIDRVRQNTFLKKLYRLPGAAAAYHYVLALFGAVIYKFPSRKLVLIGVTGTKGKTTVTELLTAILLAGGKKTATLSSVRVRIGDKEIPNRTGNSMPGRFFIQRFLRDALDANCTHAVIEVTSQGVSQARHKFLEWNVAAITNIAPEHIESHGSFERYRGAKLAFLRYGCRAGGRAFVNKDDEASRYFAENLPETDTVLYSARTIAEWPENLFGGLPGKFNRENVAAALAISRSLEIPDTAFVEALENFKGVPGRMEFVAEDPFRVVVDYAHTPNSLEAVYSALRADMQPNQRLIAVLGCCGGGRDRWKRPVMGEIVARYCDEIIFTNEDPYDEDPAAIVREMRAGAEKAKSAEHIQEILDRREAIARALALAKKGDTVILTGKGSENSIHVAKGNTIPWSEREAALELLDRKS